MLEKQDLLKNLADDFAAAVKEYRKAQDERDYIARPVFLSSQDEEKQWEESEARINSLTTSKDYVKLTREEYWQQILKAKIQAIACLGGFKFMQEFDNYLASDERDNELRLSRAFDYFADGIGGWVR